jgi:hypothetical protein
MCSVFKCEIKTHGCKHKQGGNAQHVADLSYIFIDKNTHAGGEEQHAEVEEYAQFIKNRNNFFGREQFEADKLIVGQQIFFTEFLQDVRSHALTGSPQR